MLKETNIQKNVLEKIHAGAISQHSHTYFTLRAVLLGIAALLVLASSFFVLSFVFFSVQTSGAQYLLGWNGQGLSTFITLFPWGELLVALLLLIALEILLRNFKFGYQAPLLRIFLWVIIVGAIGSTLLGFTPLHSSLLSAADNNQLPILGPVYEQLHVSHQMRGVYRGNVTEIKESSFVISHNDTDRDSDEGTRNIIPPTGFDIGRLKVGDKVYVGGRERSDIIYAYGIHYESHERSEKEEKKKRD